MVSIQHPLVFIQITDSILSLAKTGFMDVNTCALFLDGELRSIGDRELKRLREGLPLSAEATDGPKEEIG